MRRNWRGILLAAAGLAISLLALVVLYGNVKLEPKGITADARQNVSIGLNLSQHHVYREGLDDPVFYRREPFYPFLVAAYDKARGLLGFEHIPTACAERNVTNAECAVALAELKLIGAILLVLTAAMVFLLVLLMTGSYVFAALGWALTIGSYTLLAFLDRHITEVHAAFLLTLVGLVGAFAIKRRSLWLYALLGISAGLVPLTKVIFLYLWVVLLPVIVFTEWKSSARRLALALGVFLASYAALPVAWMTRNALIGGEFEVIEKRGANALTIRAAYNQMTFREFIAGFFYYTPATGRDMADWGFEKSDYARLDTKNKNGFRVSSLSALRSRPSALQAQYDKTFSDARDRILADPLAHLRAGVLLAYGALFPEDGFGYRRLEEDEKTLSESWPVRMPRPQYLMSLWTQTIYNLLATLALLLVPVLGWLRDRDLSALMAFMPAIYCHAAYASISHFLPRYAFPEIPLRAAALCVLTYYLVSFIAGKVKAFGEQRRLGSQRGPANPSLTDVSRSTIMS